MVELECTTARPGGVTLVAVRLDNRVESPGVDVHRIRLRSRIDGPTWPPRVQGVPAAPWDGDAAEVVVPTGQVGSIGFASPEPPVEPPVEIESVEPADPDAGSGPGDDPTAEDVLRVLGDPSPPRDAVDPTASPGATAGATGGTGPEAGP
ncbi:hypothetical protein L593_09070 [Salinarchaeum sp. Harcht-Bsk1]|uniref:DUF7857 domain-containing protein n=1 Tax=Salinarchaeum sp. Harcht-Bsk1 TaxID=1333523 RepID=UPI0003423E01|nr:hypothetical protein [Salinarchaeum sp. Harcht-Bsk1]AGN01759.1 hypothetical protein L593_09070 [Salinarchaeum sp. Harcht-Bsk1]